MKKDQDYTFSPKGKVSELKEFTPKELFTGGELVRELECISRNLSKLNEYTVKTYKPQIEGHLNDAVEILIDVTENYNAMYKALKEMFDRLTELGDIDPNHEECVRWASILNKANPKQ